MTEDSSETNPGPNPFLPTAVASVAEAAHLLSVPTSATRTALQHLRRYLASVRDRAAHQEESSKAVSRPESAGNVLALVGDYGSGKTHLAALLLNQIDIENATVTSGPAVTCVYLDASGTFRDLYYRFVEALTEQAVYDRVRELYVETAVQRLRDSELLEPARKLLDDPTLDPLQVTSGLGLFEPDLLSELQHRLDTVTRQPDFAAVLTMLLRPAFRDRAWDWLRGGKPDPALLERGISATISTEESALEAFTAVARVYGDLGYPFVVIIDELDRLFAKLADPADSPERRAFPRFLRSFVSAGTLLVLAALEESFDNLGGAARQRIGERIQLPPFDVPVTRQFIIKSLASVGIEGLGPFTSDSVDEIVQLTEGNARKVGLYCRQLFTLVSRDEGTSLITRERVREVARAYFGVNKREQVLLSMRRVLEHLDWPFVVDFFVSASRDARVDFWLPVGEESGCALLVTEAVIDTADTSRVIDRLDAVREGGDRESLLIVIEALASSQVPALAKAFGREPLVYHPHSFPDDLMIAAKAMRTLLERREGGDGNEILRDRLERVSSQQERLQDSLDHLLMTMREQRVATDRSLLEMREGLAEVRRVAAALVEADRPWTGALPDRVRQLFEDRLRSLDALGSAADVVDTIFREPDERPASRDRLVTIRAVMRSPFDVLTALGLSAVLTRLIEQFRSAVDDWYRIRAPVPGRRLQARSREELDELCKTYDAAFDYLPMATLTNLVRLAEAMPEGSQRRENLVLWTDRVFGIREQLESLGADVRHAILNAQ